QRLLQTAARPKLEGRDPLFQLLDAELQLLGILPRRLHDLFLLLRGQLQADALARRHPVLLFHGAACHPEHLSNNISRHREITVTPRSPPTVTSSTTRSS